MYRKKQNATTGRGNKAIYAVYDKGDALVCLDKTLAEIADITGFSYHYVRDVLYRRRQGLEIIRTVTRRSDGTEEYYDE